MKRVVRKKRPQPEHRIQSQIIEALTFHHCRVFRGNVGKFRTKDGRYISTGLPNGFSDLFGYIKGSQKMFFIEVKTPTGRIRPDQIVFHRELVHDKQIHGIARSMDDALKIVDDELIGYGYPDYKGQKQGD